MKERKFKMDILVNGKIIEPSDNEAVNNLIMSAFEVEEVLDPNTDKKIRYRPRSTPHNPIGVCNCSMCAPNKMYRNDGCFWRFEWITRRR